MARKSQALRTAQANDLLAAYREAGFDEREWAVKFLSSVTGQMACGRYPSKRQRDRIDEMVDAGIPTPTGDTELLAKIDAAIEYWSAAGKREWEQSVLGDFRSRVFKDWKLSEKQTKLLSDILQRHQDDSTGVNVFTPTPEQRADLETLVKLHRGYAGQWQEERPAVRKAVEVVKAMLSGEDTMEEYHYNKLMKAMGAKLRRVKNPRFKVMDLGKLTQREWVDGAWITPHHIVTVMTDTYVDDHGRIVNDFLLPTGEVKVLDSEAVGKIRKRKSDAV